MSGRMTWTGGDFFIGLMAVNLVADIAWGIAKRIYAWRRRDDIARLRELAEELRKTPRVGLGPDVPEGVQVIRISDTAAKRICALVEGVARRMESTWL